MQRDVEASLLDYLMRIPFYSPAYILGHNKSVLVNSSIPTSGSMDEWRIGYVSTNDNVADLLTKPIPNGEKRKNFINLILPKLNQPIQGGTIKRCYVKVFQVCKIFAHFTVSTFYLKEIIRPSALRCGPPEKQRLFCMRQYRMKNGRC